MASSYYSKAHSTRDHFNEPPSILDRAISALPSGLAAHVQVLLDRQRYDGVSTNPSKSLRQIRRSLNIRRLLSVPHLLVAIWFVVLLWGERWVFRSSIEACEWDKWERWPKGATPHHLVFLADPQLVDPHAYPDRPWPLSTASILHTDNYLKRSYIQLQKQLVPDTLFFLGDLFDGGREWKTAHGNTDDPEWTKGLRPQQEERVLKTWRKKYGENFWLKEYDRFGKIFFKYWNLGTTEAGPGQRGRKVISSLPGNHDLGFGAQVKIPIRNRFEAYFGEGNRVDVIANHTFVSIDALSLSAGSSDRPVSETAQITKPVDEFLSGVQEIKRRAVARELRYQSGDVRESQLAHGVQDLDGVDWSKIPKSDLGEGAAEFPTILLTHVPLYRNPDTPCGPMREHGGGISISKGYQYQNVLSESDSVRVVSSIGNVVSVFSGDDHDYCEIVHPPNKNSAREITVKSMSYVMGIRRPGFLMLSMWNPVTPEGKSKGMAGGHGAHPGVNTSPTFESHMCLLPDQIGILIRYGVLLAITFLTLCIRAVLTPILGLVPFDTPANESNRELSLLPTSNRDTKWEKDEDEQDRPPYPSSNSSTSSTASNPTCLAPRSSAQRQSRSVSPARGYGLPSSQARNAVPPLIDSAGYIVNAYGGVQYPTRKEPPPKRVKTIAYDRGPKRKLSLPEKIGWEAIWSVWRVAWMVILVYLWLIKFPGSGG